MPDLSDASALCDVETLSRSAEIVDVSPFSDVSADLPRRNSVALPEITVLEDHGESEMIDSSPSCDVDVGFSADLEDVSSSAEVELS